MSQNSYRCHCKKCKHEFVAHECSPENPATCTKCGTETQDCEKI